MIYISGRFLKSFFFLYNNRADFYWYNTSLALFCIKNQIYRCSIASLRVQKPALDFVQQDLVSLAYHLVPCSFEEDFCHSLVFCWFAGLSVSILEIKYVIFDCFLKKKKVGIGVPINDSDDRNSCSQVVTPAKEYLCDLTAQNCD